MLTYCQEVEEYRDQVYRGRRPSSTKLPKITERHITTGKKLVSSAIEALSHPRNLTWALTLYCPLSNTYPVWVVEIGKLSDQGFPILPGEKFQFRVDDLSRVLVTCPEVSGGSGVEPMVVHWLGW